MLKATCDHFAAEPAVTALVAELAPDVAPVVLATAHDRQLLLMEEFEEGSGPDGESVARSRPVLVQSARLLARLQIASAGTPRRLRRAGCPDRGQDDTCHGLDRVLNDGSELGRLDPTERDALEALRPRLGDLVHDLSRTGPPPALVHGDLHAGNIAATPTGSVRIFDWSDAAVAHPALDVAHLTAHLTERPGDADAVWEAWAQEWRGATDLDLTRLRALAPLVNQVYQLVTYERLLRSLEPGTTAGMVGVQAGILRRLLDGRVEQARRA